jgi:PAS domain-containing protein/DNA-binding CsgD family transcriptional regulator
MNTPSPELYDRLTAQMCDAAAGLESWDVALAKCGEAIGARSGMLAGVEALMSEAAEPYSWGLNDDYWRRYVQYFHKIEPWIPAGYALAGGRPRLAMADQMLGVQREFLSSEYYHDFAEGIDVAHFCSFQDMSLPFGPPGGAIRLAFYRSAKDGEFNVRHVELLERLMHQIPRVIALTESGMLGSGTGLALRHLVERSRDAILILDVGQHVLYANDAARALTIRSGLCNLRQGHLMPSPSLRAAISWSVGPSYPHATKLLKGRDGGHFLASIYLPPVNALGFSKHIGAKSIVVIRSLENADTEIVWPIVQLHFSLTDDELRLLQQLSLGTQPQAAAHLLKVPNHAFRARLKAIYRKTGVSGHAALISLIFRQFAVGIR